MCKNGLARPGASASRWGMARSLRIEYAGAYYHLMARGNRHEEIFLDEEDRRFSSRLWRRCALRRGGGCTRGVMMGNHYHLFVETPEANLIEGMKWLQNTYTRRFEALQREAPSVGKGVRGPLQVRGGGGRIARVLWELGGLHPP